MTCCVAVAALAWYQDLAFFRKAVEAPYDFIVEKVGQEQMQVGGSSERPDTRKTAAGWFTCHSFFHVFDLFFQDLFVENDGMDEARGVVYIYVLRKRSATGEQKVACAAPALTPTVASGKS